MTAEIVRLTCREFMFTALWWHFLVPYLKADNDA